MAGEALAEMFGEMQLAVGGGSVNSGKAASRWADRARNPYDRNSDTLRFSTRMIEGQSSLTAHQSTDSRAGKSSSS